jgi:hypothetical protein
MHALALLVVHGWLIMNGMMFLILGLYSLIGRLLMSASIATSKQWKAAKLPATPHILFALLCLAGGVSLLFLEVMILTH